MLRGIINFALDKLILPLFGNSVQLNPLNTIFYSILLSGFSIIAISRIKKSDFSMNKKLFLSSTPLFILIGSILSLSGNSMNFLIFESPYIFAFAAFITAVVLIISFESSDRAIVDFHRVIFSLPIPGILAVVILSPPRTHNLLKLCLIVLIWASIGYMVLDRLYSELKRLEFAYPVFSHYLDASTSFIALNSGGREKVFLGRFFVEFLGPGGIFVLKTLIIVPLIYYIFTRFEGEEKLYLLYFVTALGVILSVRNFFGLS